WDFVNGPENQHGLELAVINPAFVYGPSLDEHYFTSGELIRTLLRREVPGVARVQIAFVDVRDVAAALLAAMTVPDAAGQRFCCVGAICSMQAIAQVLRDHLAGRGYRIPTW